MDIFTIAKIGAVTFAGLGILVVVSIFVRERRRCQHARDTGRQITIAQFKEARKLLVSNMGPGALAGLYGFYDLASAIFPNDTHRNPALWSRLLLVFVGLALLGLGYYWLRNAFSRRRYLECPSCKNWLAGSGRDKLLSTGKCQFCGIQIFSDIHEHAA